jgi:hypothetical protein
MTGGGHPPIDLTASSGSPETALGANWRRPISVIIPNLTIGLAFLYFLHFWIVLDIFRFISLFLLILFCFWRTLSQNYYLHNKTLLQRHNSSTVLGISTIER